VLSHQHYRQAGLQTGYLFKIRIFRNNLLSQGKSGGMLSFSVKGGLNAIKVFLPKLKYAHMAANLGCVETVVGPPVVTSHVECTAEERAAAGIPEGLVRYSTGIEDVKDLIADLEQALATIKNESG
tara:strand:- start:75 stop:452 length:378 start_codon:yes stop_codon:yes gene_type:complete